MNMKLLRKCSIAMNVIGLGTRGRIAGNYKSSHKLVNPAAP